MSGYAIEYWPGTETVKSISPAGEGATVPDGFGFVQDGGELPITENQPPTDSQILENAVSEQARKLASAALKLSPLQYAVDLGMDTEEDRNLIFKIKKYMVEVNRIGQKDGYPASIDWPEEPFI